MNKEKLLAFIRGIAPRYLVILYLVLVLALGMGLSSLILLPQELRIFELESQLKTELQKVNAVENFILAHPNTEQYLTEMQRSQARVEFLLPELLDVSRYIGQLEKDARASGVKLLSVKPSVTVDRAGYREIPVELSIEGSFYAVMSFMKKLEDGDRFTLPANFLIQTKQTGLVARLNLLIFTFGNPVRTAPAPSPAPAPQPPGLPGLPAVQ